MIKITIKDKSIEADGHAINPYVCNSVSTLMWALTVALEDGSEDSPRGVREGNGYQYVEYKGSDMADTIFKCFVECFVQLAEQFPHEIEIVG